MRTGEKKHFSHSTLVLHENTSVSFSLLIRIDISSSQNEVRTLFISKKHSNILFSQKSTSSWYAKKISTSKRKVIFIRCLKYNYYVQNFSSLCFYSHSLSRDRCSVDICLWHQVVCAVSLSSYLWQGRYYSSTSFLYYLYWRDDILCDLSCSPWYCPSLTSISPRRSPRIFCL